jgi:hypothetical protein
MKGKPKIPDSMRACIIGVGEYKYLPDLPATVYDAQSLAETLKNCGYGEQGAVQSITGSQATIVNIRGALEALSVNSERETTTLIYFSGHGGRGRVNDNWETFLCTRETNPGDLLSTAISGTTFSNIVATIPSEKILIFIDACHAGGSIVLKSTDETPKWKPGLPTGYLKRLSEGSGRVVIASSKSDQVSHVRPQGDLSVFTWHLLQGLQGKADTNNDSLIRILDLFTYVSEMVKAEKPSQEPVLHAKDVDENFPVSISSRGSVNKHAHTLSIAEIRELIVHNPQNGAETLSHYLETTNAPQELRSAVDLSRARLKHAQKDIRLYGETATKKAEINQVVHSLLEICLELENAR